jgi:hypothetical protein
MLHYGYLNLLQKISFSKFATEVVVLNDTVGFTDFRKLNLPMVV